MSTRKPGTLAVAAIVSVYTLVFCVLLPVGMWLAASRIDGALGTVMAPTWLGALPAAWGLSLQLGGMATLWTRGHGWPVSALPPPKLVTGGPYRVVRHPIYFGFNLVVFGVGLMVGSGGLAAVIAPLFLPVWLVYARVEERGLVRRFGREYRRFQQQVGLLPTLSIRPVLTVLRTLRVLRVRVVEGAEHIPAEGPVVLVGNHTCYADPVWLALVTRRKVWMAATAEAYRNPGWIGTLTRLWPAFSVRRYRPDPRAARQLVDLLAAGEVVGMFCERERSVLGQYQGTEPAVAQVLPRLGVPVVPVAIQGGYATGPRWAGSMRFPTLTARIGPPLQWSEGPPHDVLDDAIRALLDEDPQRVWLDREPLEHLYRAVWRCPSCLDLQGWRPAELRCDACGGRWQATGDGRVQEPGGPPTFFADWAKPVWSAPEPLPLEVEVQVGREGSVIGPVLPLEDLGAATLRIDAQGLWWGGRHLAPTDILTTSTERADTLQIGTSDEMWQFRCDGDSPFRLQRAVDALRAPTPMPAALPERSAAPAAPETRPALPTMGAAIGVGVAVSEGLFMLLPLSVGHRAAGLGEMLPMLGAYALFGLVLEAGLRCLGLGATACGIAILGAFGALAVASQLPVAAVALLLPAGVWAWAVHHPGAYKVALPVALWGLSPILPRPAPIAPALTDGPAHGPSIALVVLDTARADRTSLERTDRDTTPSLAALAERGTWFSRAYSPSCWSLPAHASMLTGLMPSHHGAHYEHLVLDDDVPTITEALRLAGYDTAAFSANPLVARGTGLGQGFVTFAEPWRRTTVREVMLGWRAWHRFVAPSRDKAGADVVEALTHWHQQRDPDRPYFVLVNLMEAHAPYQEVPHDIRAQFAAGTPTELEVIGEQIHMAQVFGGPPDVPDGRIADLVDGALAAADAYLGQVHTILGDDVVWIVVSDHGEMFGEHEGLWGHNAGLYESLIRVPMVVALPRGLRGTVDAPVSLTDIAPTVRALAGLSPSPAAGVDLLPVLAGAAADPTRVVHAEHMRTDYLSEGIQRANPLADHAALRARRSAAVARDVKRMRRGDGSDLGVDLRSDPAEARPFPGERTALQAPLPDPSTPAPLGVDPQRNAALRALGYTE